MNKGLILSLSLFISFQCALISQEHSAIHKHDHFSLPTELDKGMSKGYYKKQIDINESALINKMDAKSSKITLPFHSSNEEFTVEEFKYYDGDVNPVKDVHTYRLSSVNNPLLEGRMVTGPAGVNIMYLDGTAMTRIYYQDYGPNKKYYEEYGFDPHAKEVASCSGGHSFSEKDIFEEVSDKEHEIAKSFGNHKRVFRVAIVTTGEYYEANGNNGSVVRQKAVQNMVDISFIYEREVNVFMIMARNSPRADYDDPDTDPFVYNADNRVSKAIEIVGQEFSNFNDYEIGHVFHNHESGTDWLANGGGNGGLASLSVCRDGASKAGGWSGSFSNDGNGFVSLAAHEFGHQYSCPHSFNGIGNSCSTAISGGDNYEMASGVTIMSYNGICEDGQNVLAETNEQRDAVYNFFHASSLARIKSWLNSPTAESCNVDDWILDNNNIPTAEGNPCGATYSMPVSTSFFLKGEGLDADGDTLTYSWEQYDNDSSLDTQGDVGDAAAQNATGPIFRNFPPSGNNVRHFPKRSSQLEGFNSDPFEVLPTRSRNLTFRFVVRDNAHAGGAVNWDEIKINVVAANFGVSSPGPGAVWKSGEMQQVTWNTQGAESICDRVDIKLSIDGGASFPIVLKKNATFGTGMTDILLPEGIPATDQARVMIVCADYECFAFYDMSREITIESTCNTQGSGICDTEPLVTDFRNPELNLGKIGAVGNTFSNYFSQVENSGPTMSTVLWNRDRTECSTLSNQGNAFDLVEFTPTESGRYFFEFENDNSTVDIYSILKKEGFDTSNPCASFVGSNSEKTGASNFVSARYMYVNLEACTEYYFVSQITRNNVFGIKVAAIEGSGTLIGGPEISSSLAYIAVDDNSGRIGGQNTDGDFTLIDPGSYKIYSVAFESGSPASWVGLSLEELTANDDCLVISENFKPVSIEASCAIVNLQTSIATSCNSNSNTYSLNVAFEVDAGPTSGTVTINGQDFTLAAGQNNVVINDLIADGRPLDLRFSFSSDAGCIKIERDVFMAPENCCNIRLDLGDQRLCIGETATLDAGTDGQTYQWFRNDVLQSGSGNTFPAEMPGDYTVIVTDVNGCMKSDQTIVSFDEIPDLELETEDVEGCQGDRIFLQSSVSVWDSIVWFRNGIVVDNLINQRNGNVFEAGLYEVKAINGGCEISDFVNVDLKASTPFSLGDDIRECLGATIVLEPGVTGIDYEWREFGSTVILSTEDTYTIVGNTRADGGRFIATGTSANGCAWRDTIRIDFLEVDEIDLGEDQEECERRPVNLDAGQAPINWYLDGELIVGMNGSRFNNAPAGVIVAETSVGSCVVSDTVVVVKNPEPVFDLGPNMSFCEGTPIDTFVYAGEPFVYLYEYFINGSSSSEVTGLDGQLEITEPMEIFVKVTTRDANRCFSTDEVVVEYVSNPTVGIIDAPTSICEENGTDIITAESSSDGIVWLLDGEITNFSEKEIEITEAGTYTAVVGLDQQCEVRDEVVVNGEPSPQIELPSMISGCTGVPETLVASQNTTYSYKWFYNEYEIDGATSNTYLAEEPGMYIVEAENSIPCKAIDTVFVSFSSASSVVLPDDRAYCDGEDASISAVTSAGSLSWYNGTNSLAETGRTLDVTEPGTYIAVSQEGQACEARDTMVITFSNSPDAVLADQSACEGLDAIFIAGADDAFAYTWYINDVPQSNQSGSLVVNSDDIMGLTADISVDIRNINDDCFSSAAATVTFTAGATLEILTPPLPYCQGSSVRLETETNQSSLTWYLNGVELSDTGTSIEISESGQYVADAGSGTCAASDTLDIRFGEAPDFRIETQSVCQDENAVFDAGNDDYSYQWFLDGNQLSTTGAELTVANDELPSGVGEVRVVAIDAIGGCTADTTVVIEFITTPTLSLEPPERTCDGEDAFIIADLTGASSLEWTLDGVVQMETGTTFTATQSGTYTAKAGSGSCAQSQSVDLVFTESPQFRIEKQSVCQGEEARFDTGNNDYTYQWFLDNVELGETGTPIIITEDQLPSGSGELRVIVTDPLTECSSDTTVIVEFITTPMLSLARPSMTCLGTEAIIEADLINAASLEWTLDGEVQSETGTSFTTTESGLYIATAGSGVCAVTAEVELEFTDSPDVSRLEKQSVCQGEDAVFDAGHDVNEYTYQWFLEGVELTETEALLTIEESQLPSGTGEVRVIATDPNSGCVTDSTVVIEFITTPSLTLVPPSATCEGEEAIIEATLLNATVLEWSIDGEEQTETGTSFAATRTGTYTATAGSGACAVTQEVELEFIAAPMFEIEKQSVCQGEQAVFDAFNMDYTYQWFLDDNELPETGPVIILDETQLPAGNGEVRVIASDNGCTTDTMVIIEFITTPSLTLVPPIMTCNGEEATIETELVNATSLVWTLDGDEQPETGTSFTATQSGTYRATAGSGACAVSQDIELEFAPRPDITMLETQSVCQGEPAVFNAGNADYTYQWFLDNAELLETGSELTVEDSELPSGLGEVRVVATDAGSGCTSDSTVVIEFILTPSLSLIEPSSTCMGQDAIIETELVNATTLEWTLDGEVQAETGDSFTATESGMYRATAGSGACAVSETIELDFSPSPNISSLEKQSVCQGEEAVFNAFNNDYSYQWFLDNEELTETGPEIIINEGQLPGGIGEVRVLATDVGTGCISDTTLIIEFISTPSLTIDEPQTACEGQDVMIEANLTGAASLEWTFDGDLLSETGTSIIATQGGTYTATAGSGQCAVTETLVLVFDANPTIELDSAREACEGEDIGINLTADITDNISWSYTPDGMNPEVITGQTGESLSVQDPGFYAVNVTSDAGCSSEETIEVSYVAYPNVDIMDLPMGVCAGTPFEVIADSDGQSFLWSDDDGPIGGATGISQVFSQSGDYVFTAINSSTNMVTGLTTDCPVEFPFSLDFIPAPVVELGGDQRICEGELVQLSIQDMPDVTYEWYLDGELLTEDGSSYEVLQSGDYELIATNDIECSGSDLVAIDFVPIPTVTTTSSEVSFCSGETATLAIITDAPNITWTLGGQVVGQDTQTLDVTEGGLYTVEVSTPENCAMSTTIDVTEIAVENIVLDDIDLCPGDDAVDVIVAGDFDSYEWSGGATGTTATISVPYNDVTTVTTETITVIASKGGCPSSASFTVTYFPIIEATVADDVVELCIGEEIQLGASGGSAYAWTDPNGSLSATDVANPIASPTENTTYEVMVSDICPNSFETVSVSVIVNPLPDAFAGDDRSTVPDKAIILEATGGVSYEWNNTDLIIGSSSIANPEVMIESDTTFIVTVTDENGCSAIDEIMVGIVEDPTEVIEVVDAFSPNGDDSNDMLEFRGLELFPINKLTIFNRWGNIVYEKRNYQNDELRWDGTRNGELLPAGTYYYILVFESFEVKNSLTLVRE